MVAITQTDLVFTLSRYLQSELNQLDHPDRHVEKQRFPQKDWQNEECNFETKEIGHILHVFSSDSCPGQ